MQGLLEENPQNWIILDEIDSTNNFLSKNKMPLGSLCLAHRQTKGRGRLGRPWLMPEGGTAFLFSALSSLADVGPALYHKAKEHIAGDLSLYSLFSLAMASALLEALQVYIEGDGRTYFQKRRVDLGFKWPNDILLAESASLTSPLDTVGKKRYAKLAGILLERKLSAPVPSEKKPPKAELSPIVLGIGINWAGDPQRIARQWSSFQKDARDKSLFAPALLHTEVHTAPKPSLFLPTLITQVNAVIKQLYEGNVSFLQKMEKYCYLKGALVLYHKQVYQVQGLAPDGALILSLHAKKGQSHQSQSSKKLYTKDTELAILSYV